MNGRKCAGWWKICSQRQQTTDRRRETAHANSRKKHNYEADTHPQRFLERIWQQIKVLDPACGSGNFLYVTLQMLKDLEKAVIVYACMRFTSGTLPVTAAGQAIIDYSRPRDTTGFCPLVGPWQLYGLEVNAYAHDLAQMTVWIGYLQWTHANGFQLTDTPDIA